MKINWAVISESTSTDEDTNNVSAFHILEEFHFPKPPDEGTEPDGTSVAPVRFVLIASFGRSAYEQSEKATGRVVLSFPGDDQDDLDVLPEFDIDLESTYRHRIKLNFAGLPLRGQGEYCFKIQRMTGTGDWFQMLEIPIYVDYLIPE